MTTDIDALIYECRALTNSGFGLCRSRAIDLLDALTTERAIEALEDRDTRQSAWLIEWQASAVGSPRWWHPERGWCTDANKALRLSRAEDAQSLIDSSIFGAGITPIEHVFLGPQS